LRIERPITLGPTGKSSLQYYKFIEGDPVRLGQVVSNLLNKAAKLMTHNGQISLTLEKVHNQAVLYVRNNGIGIESCRLGRVFGMFDQLEHPTKRDNGVGLTALHFAQALMRDRTGLEMLINGCLDASKTGRGPVGSGKLHHV
jgi:signal transduction histidine kinase